MAQACARLCAYKKVALLFLTLGPMPHERLWTLWLEGAAGLVPLEAVREPTCSKERLSHIQSHCARRGAAGGVLHAQHLFSVYIHPPPGYAGPHLPAPHVLTSVNVITWSYVLGSSPEPKGAKGSRPMQIGSNTFVRP